MPLEQPFAAFDAAVMATLERSGGLAAFRRPSGHVLLALDGTEYFRSAKIHCRHCSQRARGRSGREEWFHTPLAATLVAPGHDRVVPLPPEFVAPRDGPTKQDCGSRAVRRWLAKHGPGLTRLPGVRGWPGWLPSISATIRSPASPSVRRSARWTATSCSSPSRPLPSDPDRVPDRGRAAPPRGRAPARTDPLGAHRYRWLEDVPLRDGADALAVNWLRIKILDGAGKPTCRNSFVTDLPVSAATVAELAACGRARWKIENASFNVLKTKGYHLEHNFGHGRRHLAAVLATPNPLAFACHTVCELADTL